MPSCDFSHKMKVEGDEGVGNPLTGNVSMDDFELLKVLGKGAYGKVFQVSIFFSLYHLSTVSIFYDFCVVLFLNARLRCDSCNFTYCTSRCVNLRSKRVHHKSVPGT